ncbi:NAD(P)H-hydrate epimerase [Halarchaeum rubridurum]|uniref:Bifunctional NAD(P)H-hydrate repair enzyme n=1 Tax=Halarchaeum rubridurum TaxID=489911 RepID=A0A830FXY0_9EURY|nr:NAD(P)H-hydrate dehydratase [Halarchaeum rubridurum]MBP1953653.1 NAD(P)H-hydrate epimerase [Halarchaeum rubridurum]GGM63673.1 bifunctional ADP-dependent NAD(P)H-hydrate dehydratase/NAD(P)H-hydrate epimerase [Halarchaeum rubridurum]
MTITAARMAAVDRNAAALDVSTKQLMESSGHALARAVRDVAAPGDSVAVVAGRGNNGGDAFVAARFLDADFDVSVSLLGRPETITTDIARENWDALRAAEVDAERVLDSTALDLGDPDVVLDGVLGTGVTGAPREPERSAIVAANEADAAVVSVDVPSGMDADTGDVADVAVDADRVVTFHDLKPGLVGRDDVTVADIGIPDAAETFVGPGDLLSLERDPTAHKGDFGRVMVIGGGPYTGAPALCAQAALRAGADLAYVACPAAIAGEVQGYAADLIVESYEGERLRPRHVDDLLAAAADRDVVVIGPGLGGATDTLDAVRDFLAGYDGTAVVDADALQVVPEVETDATLVCTPHQGELVKMGGPRVDDWEERAALVAEFAADLDVTLVVKGAYDVVSDGETTRANRTGNPGMTVGGTGDVLAGITGAMASTQEPAQAAAIAAYANGAAGDAVVDEQGYGLLASDLLGAIPTALWGER